MAEITDLDGVGPARSDSLADAGYPTVGDIAAADPEVLAEEADVPEDTALDFIVQAQNIVEDEGPDPDDYPEDAESDSEDVEEEDAPSPAELAEASENAADAAQDDDADESEAATEDSEEAYDPEDEFDVAISFKSDIHYDAYLAALLDAYERWVGSHEPTEEALGRALDQARYESDGVTHTLTAYELNQLHSAVKQKTTYYKGENIISHYDALNDVLQQINAVRDEKLF